jgi:hypothetical protein
MSKGLTVLAMALVLVFCASMVWSADLDRDRLRDGGGDGVPDKERVRDRLRDGSCLA